MKPGVAQLRALAHPLRLRVVELFGEKPRTTMQVAQLLGEPPTRLYHHVNALERAGVIRLRETRRNRGTIEKWYETAVPLFHAPTREEISRARGAPRSLTSAVLMVLEQGRREVAAALSDPKVEDLIAVRMVTAGTRAQIEAVRSRLRKLIRVDVGRACRSGAPGKPAGATKAPLERWAVTLTFAPVWPRATGTQTRVPSQERDASSARRTRLVTPSRSHAPRSSSSRTSRRPTRRSR